MAVLRTTLAAALIASTAACTAGHEEQPVEDVARSEQGLSSTRVQAEDYDRYYDTTAGNTGGGCVRGGDAVDMEITTDTSGNCNVGWTASGEWLEYDVDLPTSGTHSLTLRVASAEVGKTGSVLIDGVPAGTFEAPASGWQSYENRTLNNIALSAGPHVVRIVFDTGLINLNYFTFKGPDPEFRSISSKLQAETNDGMSGLQYEACSEGGQNATAIDAGDWVEWNVQVPATGSYRLQTRSATTAEAKLQVFVDGTRVVSKVLPSTGGEQLWQTFNTKPFALGAGSHALRIKFTTGAQNLDFAKLKAVTETVTWQSADLTWFTSYPDPGSEECIEYNGCTWAGYFAALDGQQSQEWVEANNIAAVHSKDFETYKLKTLRIRQGVHQIDAVVYDMCSDSDCDGCCTANSSNTGFLIDLESYTKERFGSGSGVVEWYCLDC